MISDRLSPILVKELRQGLRARTFEGAFILLQVLMLFTLVMAVIFVAGREKDMHQAFSDVLFWFMVGIPILMVMPMRGCNAIQHEMDGQSLELLFLTRLSAWRIVAGKWGALMAQTALMVCAILPYAVVRYYLGGVQILRDLQVLAILFCISGVLTAVTVSISAFPSKLARGVVFMYPVMLLFAPSFLGVFVGMRSSGFFLNTAMPLAGFAIVIFYCVVALLYLLEFGAAKVAPSAENRTLVKRCIGFVVVAAGIVFWLVSGDEEFLYAHLFLLVPICLDALCSTREIVPGVFRPLIRMGLVGRALSGLFLPTWISGACFTIVVLGLMTVGLAAAGELSGSEEAIIPIALAATILAPAAIIVLFKPDTPRFTPFYFVIQLAVVITVMMFITISGVLSLHAEDLLCVVPVVALVAAMANEAEEIYWLLPSAAMLVAAILILLLRSAALRARTREVKDQALVVVAGSSAAPDAVPEG